jgi:hypothetical protein
VRTDAARRVAGTVVFDGLRRARALPQRRRSTRQLERLLPEVHARLRRMTPVPAGALAKPHVLHGTSDITVARLAPSRDRPLAMVKVARSEAARAELAKQHAALQTLARDARLEGWHHLLPRSTMHRAGFEVFTLERALPGTDAATVLRRRPSLRMVVGNRGLEAIGGLHRRTARVATLERPVIDGWLEAPVALLHAVHPSGAVPRAQRSAVEAVERRLRGSLTGREATLSWVHGDFTPGNVILDGAGAVTGIVDWGQSRADAPSALDAVLWVLSLEAGRRGQPIGKVVRAALHWRAWPVDDGLLALASGPVAAAGVPPGDLVLLCWLNHVADNLRNTVRYARHRWWWSANVDPVLVAVGT